MDKGKDRKWASVAKTTAPKTTPVAEGRWQQVKIRLTPEQISELERLGVKVSELKIKTFDLARLTVGLDN